MESKYPENRRSATFTQGVEIKISNSTETSRLSISTEIVSSDNFPKSLAHHYLETVPRIRTTTVTSHKSLSYLGFKGNFTACHASSTTSVKSRNLVIGRMYDKYSPDEPPDSNQKSHTSKYIF